MHAVILGIIQGLTEFLPISSSGHLLLVPYLLGWPEQGLAFDVALNTGTFVAVLIYFWRTWWRLLTKGIFLRHPQELKLLGFLILATVPAAIVGYFGEGVIVEALRQPGIAAVMLIVFGLILWLAERAARLQATVMDLNWRQIFVIGLTQALALIPGVSRSGVTMTSGLAMGLTKEAAAEFSFLLLAPVSLGAAIMQFKPALESSETSSMAVGAVVSFLVGLVAIHTLLKFVKQYGFAPYVWYRVIVGLVFLGFVIAR